MKKTILASLIGLFVLAACNNNKDSGKEGGNGEDQKSLAKKLYDDLIDAHDVGMVDWMKINGRQKKLQQWWDSASKMPDAAAKGLQSKFEEAKEALSKAYADMENWMPTMNLDSAKDNLEQRIKYLTWENENARKVNETIANSIKKADSLLQSKGQ